MTDGLDREIARLRRRVTALELARETQARMTVSREQVALRADNTQFITCRKITIGGICFLALALAEPETVMPSGPEIGKNEE
jgi:hypothetical protein